jgi:hypothetical protein
MLSDDGLVMRAFYAGACRQARALAVTPGRERIKGWGRHGGDFVFWRGARPDCSLVEAPDPLGMSGLMQFKGDRAQLSLHVAQKLLNIKKVTKVTPNAVSAPKIYLDIATAAGSHDVKERNALHDNLFGDKCPESLLEFVAFYVKQFAHPERSRGTWLHGYPRPSTSLGMSGQDASNKVQSSLGGRDAEHRNPKALWRRRDAARKQKRHRRCAVARRAIPTLALYAFTTPSQSSGSG